MYAFFIIAANRVHRFYQIIVYRNADINNGGTDLTTLLEKLRFYGHSKMALDDDRYITYSDSGTWFLKSITKTARE